MTPPTTEPDLRRPHERAWSETTERLRAYVTARVGDPHTAADIVQDVVARSIAAGALERAGDLNAWLHRSAQNAIVDHYRARRPTEALGDLVERLEEPEPDERVPNRATRELANCMRPMVEQLQPKYRDAVIAVDLDGRTHQAAATAAGISTSGMKSRVQRGRRALRDLLVACCAVGSDADGAIASYEPRRPSSDHSCGCGATEAP
jgi:RNA polymerase sigma-70 factor (ECF subfamily)